MSGREPVQMSDIELQANAITDATLEATRNMKRIAVETRQIGAATAENLNQQGEQLERIEGNLDEINDDLQKAEKHLTNMEKCCGMCLCFCTRPKGGTKAKDDKWSAAQRVNGGVVTSQPHGYEKQEVAKTGHINRITNDAREDEMDENLAVITDVVGDLKMMALDMGDELSKQNNKLDRINEKTDCNVVRVHDAEARTNKLLLNS